MFCNRLKLRAHTSFFSNGSDILAKIKELYEQADENQVAICIVDYRMPVMNATRLITDTQQYMKEHRVANEDKPRFAFRAEKFWELTPEQIEEVFALGVKSDDVIEKMDNKQMLQKYFKRVNYFYRQY